MESSPELTPLTKGILVGAGLSLSLLVVLVGLLIFRGLRRASGYLLAGSKESKKAGKSKQHQQQQQQQHQQQQQRVLQAAHEPLERGKNLKDLVKADKDAQKKSKKGVNKDDQAAGHALFLNTLKGHSDAVNSVAWNAEGTQLVTACEDMNLRVYDLLDVTSRNPHYKTIKAAKIPVGAGFGDRADEVVALMKGTNMALLASYGPSSNKQETGPFQQKWLVENVHGKEAPLSMTTVPSASACAGKGIACTLSTKKDARVYDMQGKQLAVLEPNSFVNHSLTTSRDGRFVAIACFTAEIRFWELKWAKDTGMFRGAFKAMELKGHISQVMCAAVSADNKRAATASKDGTLRVWNIDVRYELEEDPKSIQVMAMPLPQGKVYQHLAFAPDNSNLLAASNEGMVHFISANKGELLESIDAHDSTITSLSWCPRKVKSPGSDAPHAVLATSSLDKRARLWRWP